MDVRAWLESGGAAYLLMGLAAEAPSLRRLAYAGLARFLGALETGASFRERPKGLRLLHALRDAITQADQRLPLTPSLPVTLTLTPTPILTLTLTPP